MFPPSERPLVYRLQMANLRVIVRDNVLAILAAKGPPLRPHENGVSRLKAMGFPLGTAQRIMSAETNIGVDTLRDLAQRLGVQPWQLLVPNLDPLNMPGLTADTTAWPFPRADKRAYAQLDPESRIVVQAKLDLLISQELAEASRRRQRLPV